MIKVQLNCYHRVSEKKFITDLQYDYLPVKDEVLRHFIWTQRATSLLRSHILFGQLLYMEMVSLL